MSELFCILTEGGCSGSVAFISLMFIVFLAVSTVFLIVWYFYWQENKWSPGMTPKSEIQLRKAIKHAEENGGYIKRYTMPHWERKLKQLEQEKLKNVDFKKCTNCSSYAPKGAKLCAKCKSESKAYQNKSSKKDKKQIICIVCKSNITGKSALERVGKGSAGASAGFATGAWFGTAILPVIGTAIGAAYGAYAGGSLGSMQVDSICQNCCSTCKNPKQNCICRYDRYAYDEEDGEDL